MRRDSLRKVESLEELVKMLKVLANPVRLKIIAMLSEESMNVYSIAKRLKLSYPLTYLHIDALRRHGLVMEVRREGSSRGLLPLRYYRSLDFELTLSLSKIKDIAAGMEGVEGHG